MTIRKIQKVGAATGNRSTLSLSLLLFLSHSLPLSLLISTVTCTQLIMPFEALKVIIDVGFGFDLVAIQKINV